MDTDKIAQELDIDSKAVERGRNGLPLASDDALDVVEQDICQKVQGEWTWQGGELVNQLQAYAARLLQYSIKSEFQRLHVVGRDTLAKLRAEAVRAPADLDPLKEDFLGRRAELVHFKKRHRRLFPARPAARRWTTFGLMILLIAGEAAVNAFFFATGSEFGLLGGFGTAVGISIVNVFAAFAIGLGPARWINRRNLLAKLVGLILTVAGAAALFALQVFAAQYREATALVGEEGAMSLAVDRLLTAPWVVSEMSSIYLFLLGLVFSGFALWKGYHFDDPYPGYGRVSRRKAKAERDYSDKHAAHFDELEDVKAEAVEAIMDGIDKLPLFPQTAAQIRASRSAVLQHFKAYEGSVEAAVNQLLTRYRDKNAQVRETSPPTHFSTTWKLPYSFIESARVIELTQDVQETELDVDEPLRALRELSDEIISEYEGLLTRYPHPSQME